MIVGMWMTRNPVTIEPDTAVSEAAALMAQYKIRRIPVTTATPAGRRLVGIVSATDIYRSFPGDVNPFSIAAQEAGGAGLAAEVLRIMTRQVLTTTPESPIEEAAATMRERKVGALPVLHGFTLVGLITESDIFGAFISLFGAQAGGVRITFDTSGGEDLFGLLADVSRRCKAKVASFVSSTQGDRPVCVLRVTGPDIDKMLEELWRSGHQVLNVLRWP
jgi:acetoin utilization protein AcuB